MPSRDLGAEFEQPDALAEAIQVLRVIYEGASATGRWYCEEDYEAVGHDPANPDAGYYDRNNPPTGYNGDGWIGSNNDDAEPAELLKPSEWEAYTIREQLSWLGTCARTAKRALENLGVPLAD